VGMTIWTEKCVNILPLLVIILILSVFVHKYLGENIRGVPKEDPLQVSIM